MNPPGGDAGEYSSKDKRGCTATHARDVREVWATGVRPFHELFSSYRRKSFILKLKLSTKYLFGCKNYREFRRFFLPQKSLKMRDVLEKMRECGKLQNLRDFPHDCGMVDTYDSCTYCTYKPTQPDTYVHTIYTCESSMSNVHLHIAQPMSPHLDLHSILCFK